MIAALILIPALGGLLALVTTNRLLRRVLLVGCSAVHLGLTLARWPAATPRALEGWVGLDALGLVFLTITSTLFAIASVYAAGYLDREPSVHIKGGNSTEHSSAQTMDARFTGGLLLFLTTMTIVVTSQHLGLLWVAMEATTLATAPLIAFHRSPRALEATWKYLLVCSVGIALALLGNFFLAVAGSAGNVDGGTMHLGELLTRASTLDIAWLKAAFVFILVGYGTKMGLAPLHTWLPDAHSEAPSVVSALLSGALLNCALLGILRVHQVCVAAGQAVFSQDLMVGFGLLSMVVAAIFMVGQLDYKRMLAYSSVEHMGILALGVGLGKGATFGAMLHAVNHTLTKAMLFFVAGNILAMFRTKAVADVRGVCTTNPISGPLWIAGFLAITGTPPFGPFLSEFIILRSALDQGHTVIAVLFLVLLAVIFAAMAQIVLKMAQGTPSLPSDRYLGRREPILAVIPPAVCGLGVLVLGVYVPPVLKDSLSMAVRTFGGP